MQLKGGVCTEVTEHWGLSLCSGCLRCPVVPLELTLTVLMDVDENPAPGPCTALRSAGVEEEGKYAKCD